MPRETGVARSTGAREGGRGAKNFLLRNARKMTVMETTIREFIRKARKASRLPSDVKARWNLKGLNKISAMS